MANFVVVLIGKLSHCNPYKALSLHFLSIDKNITKTVRIP